MQSAVARLVAAIVSSFAVWFNATLPDVMMNPDVQQWLVGIIVYAITHYIIERKTNPAGIVSQSSARKAIGKLPFEGIK